MKQVTKLMIQDYKIKELGCDFMGFHLNKTDMATFHHLIIPNREGGPYARWNGAILNGETSHPYLHLIESVDYEKFCHITSEMIDMNVKGHLDPVNLEHINEILCQFEKEHGLDRGKGGKYLIKDEYRKRILQ